MIARRLWGDKPRKLRFGDDEPETFRLITTQSIDECEDILGLAAPELPWHTYFIGTTEQLRTWHGKGHPVIGRVFKSGFELEQKVHESPFRRKRIAVGAFEPIPNGTLIVFQLDFATFRIGLDSIAEAYDAIVTLTSSRWKRFDHDEAVLFVDFLSSALCAELVSQEVVDELRRSHRTEKENLLPALTSPDEFLAALDAIIRDADDERL